MNNKNIDHTPYIPWYAKEYNVETKGICSDYKTLTPQDIKKILEKNVVNQEEACRRIAVMMYQHFQGHRFVGLLAGPTGSGKSFIAENLQAAFPDIVYIRDISNVTNEGWKGEKKVKTLFHNIKYTDATSGLIAPIVFLDECDKLFEPKYSNGGDNVSESIQAEFLTVIHGTELEEVDDKGTIMDTARISFLFSGAFEKRAKEKAIREKGTTIGFGASQERIQSYHRPLTMEDVQEAGCITELCGRIQTIVNLNKLSEKDFRSMLEHKNRGPVREMEDEFKMKIRISKERKDEIAHTAYVNGTGVRGIKNRIREYIDDIMWEDCQTKTLEIV